MKSYSSHRQSTVQCSVCNSRPALLTVYLSVLCGQLILVGQNPDVCLARLKSVLLQMNALIWSWIRKVYFFLNKSEEKLLAVRFSKWCSVIWLQAVTNLHCLHGVGSRRVMRADLVTPFSIFWLILKQSRACMLDFFWIKVNWKVQPESTCQRSVHRIRRG